jgi:AraC-like DNA-binding protein
MMLNTNRNYIYNAINKEIGMSFSDYTNLRRIQYAATLIDNHPKAILADVAQKSGFSSASSFYRNFKSIMGCTPSEYQRKTGASITASTLPK